MSYLKYDGSAAAETNAPVSDLYGSSGAETLTGTSVAESLWGQGGDTMIGGAGDDTYYLQDNADKVIEQANGGTDMVVAWQNVSLAKFSNIENVKIDGDGIYAAGNSQDNVVIAGNGAEQLYGGAGQDVMVAGSGQDTFIVVKGEGNDAIYGFKAAGDVVRLSAGYSDFSQVQSHMTQVGADVKIDLGGADGLILRGVQMGQLTAANFQLQIDPTKVGAMSFHDEFSSPLSVWNATYNPTGTWRPDYGYQGANGAGSYTLPGNGEQQIYTSPYFRDHNGDFGESPFVSNPDGTLSIIARPSTNPELFGYGYTSGMISTKESYAQTYGYFEMRAELPQAAGGWPAFWLVPADGSWPPELDVMETLTVDPNADHTTQHSGLGGVHTQQGLSSYIPDTASGFHTYGVLWTATDLTWFVDGAQVFHTATPADMNKPMYMIANLALGGWGGAIDNAQMPEEMKIDYIRAYSLGNGTTAGLPVSPPPVSPPPPPPVSLPPISPPAAVGVALTSSGYGATLTGGAGADTLTSSQGGETLTGGAGADVFAIHSKPWTPVHIADFQVGVDKLDLSGLYEGGYHGTDPVADGYVQFFDDGAGGTKVLVDLDGPGSAHPWPDYIVNLDHVTPGQLTAANLFGAGTTTASPPPVSPPPVSPPPVSSPPVTPGVALTAQGYGATLTGGAGADTLTSGQGGETLTGGAGADVFAIASKPWTPVHIADFQLGVDRIDLSGLYEGGYHGTDPVADGYVKFFDDGAGGTKVLVDLDGPAAGHPWPDYVFNLDHVAVGQVTAANVFGTGAASPPPPPPPVSPPAVAGVTLTSAFVGDTLTGGAGNDTLNASRGQDQLTGGAGNDRFVFGDTPWAPAQITDFTHGQDVLDLKGVFAHANYSGSDPVADHYLSFISDGQGGTTVLFDADGAAPGQQWGLNIIHLQHVDPATITAADWVIR
jgi:serralysin